MNVFMMRPGRLGVFDIGQTKMGGQKIGNMNLAQGRLEHELADQQFHVGFPYITIGKQL